MYDHGAGGAKNYQEALKWYKRAADQGDACGQYELGLMYEEGRGVEPSDADALSWFVKAAEQGEEDAIEKCKQQRYQSLLLRKRTYEIPGDGNCLFNSVLFAAAGRSAQIIDGFTQLNLRRMVSE